MTTTTARTAIIDRALTDAQQAQRSAAFLRAQTPDTALANWQYLFEMGRYRAASEWFRAMVVPTQRGNQE